MKFSAKLHNHFQRLSDAKNALDAIIIDTEEALLSTPAVMQLIDDEIKFYTDRLQRHEKQVQRNKNLMDESATLSQILNRHVGAGYDAGQAAECKIIVERLSYLRHLIERTNSKGEETDK